MTDVEMGKINRELGELRGEVKTLRETWQHQDEAATVGRRELHRKFDELKDALVSAINSMRIETAQTKLEVTNIGKEVTRLEPKVLASYNADQQQEGHNKALARVWATLLGLVTVAGGVGAGIAELVHFLMPPKPPL